MSEASSESASDSAGLMSVTIRGVGPVGTDAPEAHDHAVQAAETLYEQVIADALGEFGIAQGGSVSARYHPPADEGAVD